MKKIIMMLTLIMGLVVSANAQTAIVDNGTAKDNWYVAGGVGTNVWNNTTYWLHAHDGWGLGKNTWETTPLHINLSVGKYFTPYVGAEVDGTAMFNVGGLESCFVDAHHISGNVVVNLSNIIAGYNGKRHLFDVEALVGMGWYHTYSKGTSWLGNGKDGNDPSFNDNTVRGAIRANLNVSKNWSVYVMPEYVSAMEISTQSTDMCGMGVNVSIGAKYRIPSKRGNFPLRKLYDQGEIDRLNTTINTLQNENANLAKANADLAETIKKLIAEGGKVKVETTNVGTVLFACGKSDVTDGSIADVVKALKNSKGTITLTGNTSPEGGEALNKQLASERAAAVKAALIANGIDASRIAVKNNYDEQRSVVITLD